MERYPDPDAGPAREAIGAFLGVSAGSVVVGNGAVEILWAAARALGGARERVLVVEPAFSEFRRAAALTGSPVLEFRTIPEDDFAIDLRALRRVVETASPRVVHLAAPGNPSGRAVPLADVAAVAASLPETVFVVDVSFVTLGERAAEFPAALRASPDNAVWVWSLTKEQSLPGVRLGCAVATPPLARALRAQIPPWSTGAAAQAAAVAAMRPSVREFVDRSRRLLSDERRWLAARLRALGLKVHPSDAPYVLAHRAPPFSATALRGMLLERHGVLVRDATSFGLPGHLRLAARPTADVDRLIHALQKELR